MHIYIYDEYVNKKKYENVLAKIETRITDLGLNGKIIRLDVMKNIKNAVENEIRQGAKTIIAVGNDKTVNQVASAIINHEDNEGGSGLPFGIIPIGEKNNLIAAALGIKDEEEACDILSARRIEKIDVVKVNALETDKQHINYFLRQAVIESRDTIIEINQNCSIEITEPGKINIINLPALADLPKKVSSNPQDGRLELYIQTKPRKKIFNLNPKKNKSFFSFKKLTVINKKAPLILDDSIKISLPAEIKAIKKRLSVIIGKERGF